MLGPLDYLVWLAILPEIGVAVCVARRGEFRRYSLLVVQVLASAASGVGCFFCLREFGFTSPQYFYLYFYSDTILCVFMYLLVIQLYERVFEEINARSQIRLAAAFLLLLTAGFSAVVVHNKNLHLASQFAVELEQNLNFVGVVLVYALWGAVMKMKKTRTRLAQIVLALGVYFSGITVTYALCNLFPVARVTVYRWMPPFLALWLPLAWTYAFLKSPERKKTAKSQEVPEPKVLPAWQEATVR